MRCSKCGIYNREGAHFCNECGTPLSRKCQACGALNQPSAKFCDECGVTLTSDGTKTERMGLTAALPAGERRHLTVLFCDLVNSTAIAAQLDPEEWREIVTSYHRAATESITQFGGYVAQYLGDGVMAYFGFPEAHDNNAERAAHAGLAILDVISKLTQGSDRPQLSARVGIDSGAVVVATSAGKNADVFGDTPNIAARVQAAAAPGTILITADTQRLLAGLFVVEDRGAQVLKGIERPIQLYQLMRPSGVRGRIHAAVAARALTPFVGRDDELRLLMTRWERALEGEGQVVVISGEGGIGKSRLVQRFHQQIGGRPHNWFEAAAAPFFQNTPLYPIGEMLRELQASHSNEPNQASETIVGQPNRRRPMLSSTSGSNGHSANRTFAEKEEQLRDLASSPQLDITPSLAVAQITLNLATPMEHLAAVQAQRRLLSTLVAWVLDAAHVLPVVIAIEDLHWADASTLELIQLLVEQAAATPLLLLCTSRPEFLAKWPPRAHLTQITLSTLSAHQTRRMVEQVAGQKTLTAETVATVVERTGGVPLFIEELTRAVLERGDLKLARREIPATLHDSLMARLDRLGSAKEVLQIAAVIGREFSYDLLHAVHPIAEEDLKRALSTLTDAELLYMRGIAPDAHYLFKHALIQDAAYEALLKSRRRDLHRIVAHAINDKFPALKETEPEVLARHWTEAGEAMQAIVEWTRAGESAEARHAFREALESYRQASALLNLVPKSADRDLREVKLSHLIVGLLWITKGYSVTETIEATRQAAALAEKSGSLQQLLRTVHARGIITLIGGDLPSTAILADQVLDLAVREGSPASLELAYNLQMETHFFRGDLAGAESYFTAGSHFSTIQARGVPQEAVSAFGFASLIAWMLGQSGVARERTAKMMAVASGRDPFTVAFSEVYAAQLRVLTREYELAEAAAASALEVSRKHQLPYPAALSECLLGHARAQLGRATEGIALITQGLARLREAESRLCIAYFTSLLAAAQEREGTVVEALETIEPALQANSDELVYRPETLRIRGELRLKHGQTELAEADFHESNELARSMGAKAWELRTTTSLARLLAKHGRRDEAHTIFAEIYRRFTEGFDTADLREAKTLLDELNC